MYTIENFWRPRLKGLSQSTEALVRGWSYCGAGCDSFVEAPLGLCAEMSTSIRVEESPLILVSAPGAVGKSTLAKQISFECEAIYLDLAAAEPVGGNTISGGILKSKLPELWTAGKVAIMIDGLDEARLRVTQEAYEAFLVDIAELARDRDVPTVLFGRTGAVQDAFLVFAVNDIEVPVLEIGYYDFSKAVEFAMAHIRIVRPDRANEDTERRAVSGLINGLSQQTENDGKRFAGYAPVLQAVAGSVGQASNPKLLVSALERGDVPMSLGGITSAILDRERSKLERLSFSDQSLSEKLYTSDEQLHRLAAKIYRANPPCVPRMTPRDAEIYDSALKTWVDEHPFLDGNGKPSSAVFGAAISAWAMQSREERLEDQALHIELERGVAANPFFTEFYKPRTEGDSSIFIPAAHIGVFYNSLRAGLSLGDSASLIIDDDEEALEEEALRAEIEITLSRREVEQPRTWTFSTDLTRVILLGPYIEDVAVSAKYATVDVGSGAETTFVAPVTIQCGKLQLGSERVVVEQPVGKKISDVFLEAVQFVGNKITMVPTIRGEAKLSVSWPGSRAHPWTAFSSDPTQVVDPREEEALRRFRKFIISFRSHSKGSLRRFKDKLEHSRMTKGSGRAVLEALKENSIILSVGFMYELDPGALLVTAGASYHDCVRRKYGEKTILFVRAILDHGVVA